MSFAIAALALLVSQAPAEAPPPAAAAPDATTTTTPAPEPAAASPLPPPKGPRLLVLDLIDKGAGKDVTNAVSQAVQGQAVQSHTLGEVVTTTQLRVVLDGAALQQLLGCESEQCMTDVGKQVEASVIVGGSVAKVGDDFVITVLATNARDGTRLGMQQRKVPSNKELYFYAARQLTALVLTGRSVDPTVPVVITVGDGKEGTFVVDGKEVATGTTTTVNLDPGSHEIRVRKGGYAEWKTLVTVEDATPLQVTAQLVEDRIDLWPVAIGTGVLSVATGVTALYFLGMAENTYRGAFEGLLPFYDSSPATSYDGQTPVDSKTLFEKQQQTELGAGLAIGFGIGTGVLVAATVGLVATDLILAASAE